MTIISIIIPVYNTSRYIKKCIKSVTSQTFQDYEIIIVNDCSTDNSLDICNNLAQQCNKIKIVSNSTNQGLSKTRHIGLSHASGKYIMFIDSDDFLENNALSTLYNLSQQYDCDIVIGQARKFIYNKTLTIETLYCPTNVLNRKLETKEVQNYYISFFGINIIPVQLWGKLYKRELWDRAGVKAREHFFGEDLMTNLLLHPYVNSIYITSDIVYNYRYGGGINSATFQSIIHDAILLYKERMTIAESTNFKNGISPLRVELKNYIKSAIYSCCSYRQKYINEDIIAFKQIMNDECFNDLKLINTQKCDDIDKAIINRDIEQAFHLTQEKCKTMKYKIIFKRIMRYLAQYL